MASTVQRFVERGQGGGEACQTFTLFGVFNPVDDLGGKYYRTFLIGEIDHGTRTGLKALAGAHQHFPDGRRVVFGLNVETLTQQEHLCLAAGVALGSQKASGHDAGFVGYDQVALLQMVDDVAEGLIVKSAVLAFHDQHAAAIALGGGFLGNKLFGQVVVEIVGTHVH